MDARTSGLRHPLLATTLALGLGAILGCSGPAEPDQRGTASFTTAMGQQVSLGRLRSCWERSDSTHTERRAVFDGGRIWVWDWPEVGRLAAAAPDTARRARGVAGAAADSLDAIARDLGC